MTAQSAIAQSQLYDRDLARWYAETLAQLKAGDLENLDVGHLIEEIEGLAARDRREIKTRLKVLLAHLLKRIYVPLPDNYRGWENTIDEQREQLQDLLEQSPSLESFLEDSFAESWQRALKQVRNDYPEVSLPDLWPGDRTVESILTKALWQR
ncbi:DUF29 domain-containing protein [Leptolyngbya sp. CCNP1308]|uniref:DUF29 domain-containing protein n=1 Tax=Leptolyngbya sp. CCNP1308 TaxID=3110255 RepID=UPI002B2024EC|nr:DUF29 domain-containing protein [Leptolyngbya sp. CCNP1308]MEA5450063.1 DUF29 domain-containing protein [Leptolyngbya sp. CCNP1308]